MGLFGSQEELDSDLRAVVVGDDRDSLKKIAKAQPAIKAALNPGEVVTAIAYDQAPIWGVAVLTSQRLMFVHRGKVSDSITPDRISQTRLLRHAGGNFIVSIDGPGKSVMLKDERNANTLAFAIDTFIQAG